MKKKINKPKYPNSHKLHRDIAAIVKAEFFLWKYVEKAHQIEFYSENKLYMSKRNAVGTVIQIPEAYSLIDWPKFV